MTLLDWTLACAFSVLIVQGCVTSRLERHAMAADTVGSLVNQATDIAESLYEERQKEAIVQACGQAVFVRADGGTGEVLALGAEMPPCQEEARKKVANVRMKWSRIWHLQEHVKAAHDRWRESIQLAAAMSKRSRTAYIKWTALAIDAISVYDELVKALRDLGIRIPAIPKEIERITRGE